jgi:hypothetical protein
MHIPEYADVSEADEIVFSAGSDELLLELMRDIRPAAERPRFSAGQLQRR